MRLAPFRTDLPPNPVAGSATLDEILALNAARDPEGLALVADDLPFPGTWREVDRAVSALAETFRSWGLGEDATVGVQLGSSHQGALTCLALWRAGLVPAMLPLAWRRREMVAALASIGATAIVVRTGGGGARHAEVACEVAAGLETIRFVGSLGGEAPDGATPLDETLALPAAAVERTERPEDVAEHVAVVTFDAGGAPVARSHNELLAAGLAPLIAARLGGGSALLSTLDLAGLAGLATGLAPWLATGCAANFHQPSSTEAFAKAARDLGVTHLVAPGRAAARLAAEGRLDEIEPHCVTAVWRAPDGRGGDIPAAQSIVDVTAFGELGVFAAARTVRDRPAPLPLGPAGPEGFPPLIELRVTPEGRLTLRGPACPQAPCPAHPAAAALAFDAEGWLETGLSAIGDRLSRRVSLGGTRRGVAQIGGLAVSLEEAEAAFRRSGVEARPVMQDDPLFGTRFAIKAADGEALAKATSILEFAGFGPALAPLALAAEPALKTA
jgi:hypothetical protein